MVVLRLKSAVPEATLPAAVEPSFPSTVIVPPLCENEPEPIYTFPFTLRFPPVTIVLQKLLKYVLLKLDPCPRLMVPELKYIVPLLQLNPLDGPEPSTVIVPPPTRRLAELFT